LVASVAVSASRSFYRERETGLLELLLVSPLRESQIISGRVRGLWSQFIPSIALLLGLWLFFATFLTPDENEYPSVLYYASTLLALPIIGLYESLARSSFIGAFLSTLFLGVAVPAIVTELGNILEFTQWVVGLSNINFKTDFDTHFI